MAGFFGFAAVIIGGILIVLLIMALAAYADAWKH